MNTRPVFLLIVIALLSACASSSSERPAPATPETAPEVQRASDAPVDQAELNADEPDGLRAEMDAVCVIVGTGDSSDPAAAMEMAEQIDAAITHEDLRQAWAVLQNADPSLRHSMLQRFAQENGVSGWQCPAMDAGATP